MLLDWIFLIIGLALILWGANALTDGASALARRFGMSDLMVGLTVVAMGTSAPELTISVISAINDHAGLAIGNVVGSNIFNILVIVGVTAMVRPIRVTRDVMTAEIPLVVLSSLVLLAIGLSPQLNGTAAVATRTDGIILLLFFLIFMRHTFASAQKAKSPAPACEPQSSTSTPKQGRARRLLPPSEAPSEAPMPLWKSLLLVVLGLAALIYGGDRFVAGASGIASQFGVSDALIGLTIVALGTSLPELATSVVAAIKGKTGMALGNVIGSNIFNIFLVLGTSATIRPLPFGSIGAVDLLVLTGASLLFWVFGWFFGNKVINRAEGAVLLCCYVAYTLYLVSQA